MAREFLARASARVAVVKVPHRDGDSDLDLLFLLRLFFLLGSFFARLVLLRVILARFVLVAVLLVLVLVARA